MYLSRIALNVEQRETMRALASPQLLHGAIEQSLGGERQRNLWRIDWFAGTCYLLLLSSQRPELMHVVKQFGYPDSENSVDTKDYYTLLARLKPGQVWRFRLRANPVRSSSRDKGEAIERGKVHAHVTQEQQKQWLYARAAKCGFELAENGFDIVHTQWLKFSKGHDCSGEVTLRTATFEGVLTITDLERFKQSLLSGIGRAKAYGCGLLTITRL